MAGLLPSHLFAQPPPVVTSPLGGRDFLFERWAYGALFPSLSNLTPPNQMRQLANLTILSSMDQFLFKIFQRVLYVRWRWLSSGFTGFPSFTKCQYQKQFAQEGSIKMLVGNNFFI